MHAGEQGTHSACRREGAQSPQSRSAPSARRRVTHRGVRHTAGEGHPTFLTAVAGTTAVKVDIEVPVFGAICPTTLVL